MSLCRDITERRKAAEVLQNNKARLEEAEHLARIGSIERDFATDKTHRSEGFLRIYGTDRSELGEKPESFLRYVHEDDRARVQETMRRNITENAPSKILAYAGPTAPYASCTWKARSGRISRAARSAASAWIQDITERRGLEEKVLGVSDRERRNIGHDLHDDIGQQLTGIALLGRALQDRLPL